MTPWQVITLAITAASCAAPRPSAPAAEPPVTEPAVESPAPAVPPAPEAARVPEPEPPSPPSPNEVVAPEVAAAPATAAEEAPASKTASKPVKAAPSTSAKGDASAGREHFVRHCSKCHGEDGRGQTLMGKKLGAADMTDSAWQAERNDRDMRAFVRRGAPARKQPAFGPDKLDDQALRDVIAYIRTLSR